MIKIRHIIKRFLFLPMILLIFIDFQQNLICASINAPDKLEIISINNKKFISLYDFSQTGVDYYFNVLTQKTAIYFKHHKVFFQPGLSIALVDGKLYKSSYPVIRRDGEILIPLYLFEMILSSFYSNDKYLEKGDLLVKNNDSQVQIIEKLDPVKAANLKKEKITFIVIDAGHGGKDPGALGSKNVKEKTITLEVAKRVQKKLKLKLPGIKIVLTRKSDKFIELGKRTEIANKLLSKNNNGIFISIHVNASLSSKVSGYETYFLSQNASNEEARATAALENNVVVLEKNKHSSKQDVEFVEALMLTTQIQNESKDLAKNIQTNMRKRMKVFSNRGVKKADFFVLRGVLMPAALVEIGYITHKNELKYLMTASYQNKVSDSITSGISDFIKKYNSSK